MFRTKFSFRQIQFYNTTMISVLSFQPHFCGSKGTDNSILLRTKFNSKKIKGFEFAGWMTMIFLCKTGIFQLEVTEKTSVHWLFTGQLWQWLFQPSTHSLLHVFFKSWRTKCSEKTFRDLFPSNSIFLYWSIVTCRKDSTSDKEGTQLFFCTLNVFKWPRLN